VGFRAALGVREKKKPLTPSESRILDSFAYSTVIVPILLSQPLPLQVMHGYIHEVPAEMDYISFKILC
jgi:hypothetical protein